MAHPRDVRIAELQAQMEAAILTSLGCAIYYSFIIICLTVFDKWGMQTHQTY
jgi:hypothetical protein